MIRRAGRGACLVVAGLCLGATARAETPRPASTIHEVVGAFQRCWRPPPGLTRLERIDQTVRFSLRRDGSLIGLPWVTYASAPADSRLREILNQSAVDAIARCAPVRLQPGLGAAIAGRPLAIRFIYEGPKGRGV